MSVLFLTAGGVALVATALALTRRSAVHALLYLVVSQLATALLFFLLGAPFAAALEVIIYAGAIMILFVFTIMILGPASSEERMQAWIRPGVWAGPAVLALVLAGELAGVLWSGMPGVWPVETVSPAAVGLRLFGPYLLGVELASLLLLAGVIGAYHLARPTEKADEEEREGGPS